MTDHKPAQPCLSLQEWEKANEEQDAPCPLCGDPDGLRLRPGHGYESCDCIKCGKTLGNYNEGMLIGLIVREWFCGVAPGYIAPVSVPGSADQVWDQSWECGCPRQRPRQCSTHSNYQRGCPACALAEDEHRTSCRFYKPAPAEAPKVERLCVCGHAKREHAMYEDHEECQACEDRDCDRYRPAPAPASVTPASDQEIARAAAQGFVSYDTGMSLIARIEQEKAANAELRARVESDLMQQNATAKALRAELAAIKAQASDATEYVLAVENRELRAEVGRLNYKADQTLKAWQESQAELAQAKVAQRQLDSNIVVLGKLREELAQAREALATYQKSAAQRHVDDLAELAQAKEEIERRGKLVLEAGGRENGLRADPILARKGPEPESR